MTDYKHHKRIGIGGIKCPCCRPEPSTKTSKVIINRAYRRKAKRNLAVSDNF